MLCYMIISKIFHERIFDPGKEARKTIKEPLLTKYPYIDLSRFQILTNIDNARDHAEVLFMDMPKR